MKRMNFDNKSGILQRFKINYFETAPWGQRQDRFAKRNKKQDIFLLVMLLFCSISFGQQEQTDTTPKIIIKSMIKPDRVLLRWAVDDKNTWKLGNQYGYIVERTTAYRDGQLLSVPERVILSGDTIKPQPLNAWESLVETNDMAAVVAQGLYGDSFEIEAQEQQSAVMQVFYESGQLEKRFAFSLFAMDQDFEVAQMAGMGFVDTSVKKNETYLYKIKSAIPSDILQVQPGGIAADMKEIDQLPKPTEFFGYYYQDSFVLVWEYDNLLTYYNAYDLERSEDGKTFTKLNEVPITKLATEGSSGVSFTDSIPEYGQKFYYRVVGRNYFGETGPSSEPAELIAFKEIQAAPLFTENEIISDQEVILNWSYPEEEQWKLKKYELLRADQAIGPYKVVNDSISPEKKTIKYSPLSSINYFKLKAYGKHQDMKLSPPMMIQPIDSIPPAKPKGLTGTIDTLGIVSLQWNKNPDLDLKGYDIFRKYREKQEFTKLNKENLVKENFIDSIDMTSFDDKVYYRIEALDNRYNASVPSETLTLEKPDRIPPTPPVFKNYEVDEEGISIYWIHSSVADWNATVVYRKVASDTTETSWRRIFEATVKTDTTYVDQKIIAGEIYAYTLITVDASGLESDPAPALTIESKKALTKPGIKGVYATVDRENKLVDLTWRIPEENSVEIQLYRKTKETEFILYQRLQPDVRRWIDQNVQPNTVYTYGFKTVYTDGSISEWKKIEVTY